MQVQGGLKNKDVSKPVMQIEGYSRYCGISLIKLAKGKKNDVYIID